MMTMSSTLVETVSIDYEDFNESFLTCGTCLCMYDGGEHTPKLLPCSHTVCLQCLDRIVATFARDTGQFRCPICRELITIPRGGVQALPPSFLVNQLLDLMARQRREVIPKCSTHHNQELLFCETCDTVFCTLCTGGTHNPPSSSSDSGSSPGGSPAHAVSTDHTVIPFSIAIKRMSEILIYKANECRAKLNEASDIVTNEMHRLDHNADTAFESVNTRFQAVLEMVEQQRQAALQAVTAHREAKKKVLLEQKNIINTEKEKVDNDVKTMQHQVEVRNITKKIADLNCKLDEVSTLSEPRENSYIEYLVDLEAQKKLLDKIAADLENSELGGQVKTSKTFPSLCRCTFLDTAICHLEATAKVTTIDYNGEIQTKGGDPIEAKVMDDQGQDVPVHINDKADGSYELKFTPHKAVTYCLKVMIFNRPIKDCPLFFDVTWHNPPLVSFGVMGNKEKGFVQPCNVAIGAGVQTADQHQGAGASDSVFVVDTGNSRIKKLSTNLDFEGHIYNECLEGRSVTGLCLGSSQDSLIVTNWRSKTITEITLTGQTINSFTHDDLKEPVDVTLDPITEHILVADTEALLVFESSGKLIRQITSSKKGSSLKDVSAVCVSPTGEYIVADANAIHVFSSEGIHLRQITPPTKGRFGGLACDNHGFLLTTHTCKKQSTILVFRMESGDLYSTIDSHGAKMKRPTGLAILESERSIIVADIGFHCVRKYRYY